MTVELRGTISAALARSSIEVELSAEGMRLSELLESLADRYPRARRYLSPAPGPAVLRAVHNGAAVPAGDDPLVGPEDRLLLMHAIAGGSCEQSGKESANSLRWP